MDEAGEVKIDQIVIGSCTNCRIDDLRTAAKVFAGRSLAPHVRGIVIPATQKIYLQAMEEGLLKVFVDAGCVEMCIRDRPCAQGACDEGCCYRTGGIHGRRYG